MNRTEIAERLALPSNTNQRNIVARALRTIAGGAELVTAKEWAAGIANTARTAATRESRAAHRDEILARRRLAEDMLDRLAAIETALLTAIEVANNLPTGSLVAYQRGGVPE